MKLRMLVFMLAMALVCSRTTPVLAESAVDQRGEIEDEAEFSIPLQVDAGGRPLDGAVHRYTITFAAAALPPAQAWSLVLYSLPDQNLVTNSIHRHAMESRMLPHLVRNKNDSLTIYVQRESPPGKLKANWLPSTDGPFLMVLKLYRPGQAALDGAWEAPGVERME